MSAKDTQTTDTILMVRPKSFGFNEQTASNNSFQQRAGSEHFLEISAKAKAEFDDFVAVLRKKKINVKVIEDTMVPTKPDAIFPNNWVSFHRTGMVVLYPMYAPNRRLERRNDILATLKEEFEISSTTDMSHWETKNLFLEGTGSMILDRTNRYVYACLSPRTDQMLLNEFCKVIGYHKVEFTALDRHNLPIYHTNVVMAMGDQFVVICMATIPSAVERGNLMKHFLSTNKEVIDISLDQMEHFAGNMLQVRNTDGETFLVMSEQAYKSLTEKQIVQIEKYTNILHTPLYTIENYGGGSARCMMAEVFLPRRNQ